MTAGKILRTNYRRTGGIAGITELGFGIAGTGTAASMSQVFNPAISGLGGNTAGGLIFVACSTSTIASGIITLSAFGVFSQFYGSGVFDSGYAIVPVAINPISFSGLGAESTFLVAGSLRASASLAYFTPWAMASASGAATALPAGATCEFQLLAVVVSGP